jgi:hypothetical protein
MKTTTMTTTMTNRAGVGTLADAELEALQLGR